MSWTNELYQIYENQCGREFDGEDAVLLPVSHSTAIAQIEITLKEDGSFSHAEVLEKKDGVTIIPVTEDSGARANGVCPMPFADKLLYIAGDYPLYATGKRADNTKYYEAYMGQLARWRDSDFSHDAVKAVYAYLEQKTVMQDLIRCGILQQDPETGKLVEKMKISGIAQEDAFVRFRIAYTNFRCESRTWKDASLYDSFISYNSSCMGNVQLCYALGREMPSTYKHPSKIRNSGDKAKLISANDESGFSYKGRFRSKEEAISVSYDFSQKFHNALKWLIARQGMQFDSLTILIWASALQSIPNAMHACSSYYEEENFGSDDVPDTEKQYANLVQKMIFGYQNELEQNTKVMVMGLDAATTGRLSISIYSELEQSRFFENLQRWHEQAACLRFHGKQKRNWYDSVGVYEIAKCAYGTEVNDQLDCKPGLLKNTILRVLPCIIEGRKVPNDIVRNLYHKASNPLAYEQVYHHRTVLEVACCLIRKQNLEQEGPGRKKGITVMSYDPNEKDRSYLYGCLLAIADKAEYDTYDEEDRKNRVTNARRYWNAFSARPSQTWGVIVNRLQPYLQKNGDVRKIYDIRVGEIMEKMSKEVFEDNSALEPCYLLGYHHFTSHMYKKDKNEEE